MPRARLGITAHHLSHDPGGNDATFNHILARVIADVDIANSAVETDCFRFTVPANTLLASGNLRLTLGGDFLDNIAGTGRLRVYFGATVVLDTGVSVASTLNATRAYWGLVIHLLNAGATNAQRAIAELIVSAQAADFVVYSTNNASPFQAVGFGTAAEDSTLARDLAVTFLWSAANAALSWRTRFGLLERYS